MPNVMARHPKASTAEELRLLLGFDSKADMDSYLQGRLFKPYLNRYEKDYIIPAQNKAERFRKDRRRRPTLFTVEKRIAVGNRYGSDKFSDPYTNTDDWDAVDFMARTFYWLRQRHTKNAQGLFYKKGVTESEINARLWAVIKYCELKMKTQRKSGASVDADDIAP